MDAAHKAGADGCELDVVLTRDAVPVLLHDLNLLRTTDAARHPAFRDNPPALPWRFTLAELETLDAGIFPRRLCGRRDAGREASFGVQRIPTLAQALGRCAELGLLVNVEIKDVSAAMPAPLSREIVGRTLAVVRAQGMEQAVLVSSFNADYVRECKALAPEVAAALLTPHAFNGETMALVRSLGADAWHPGYRRLTQRTVAAARNEGLAVTPYTVNDPADMARLAAWGVCGIVTDRPQDAPREISGQGPRG